MQTYSTPTKDDMNKDAMKDYASSKNPHMGSDVHFSEVASKAASDVANKAMQSARTLMDEGKVAANHGLEWVNEHTRATPMRSLGIAACIGLVIGMLISRR
jgi:ElaB/YqjD/DUF883 family membrane-anchored ribosome-binding protein